MSFGMSLDLSMDQMEETRILKKYSSITREMLGKYHFNQIEVETLILVYHKIKLIGGKGANKLNGITKIQFMEVLHSGFSMTDDTLMERIISALESKTGSSVHPSVISIETWICAMSIFLRGNLDEQIEYCFACYNVLGDGLIGRDVMFHHLKKSMISSGADDDAEEAVKDMIEILTKKMDKDRDGKISFNDYKLTVTAEPMLLECMGQCLPSRLAVHTFVNTIFPDPGKI